LDSARHYRRAALALIAVVFAFRAWWMTTMALSGDEAYHWEWSRHLALGYHDHPGLTGWLIWLSTALFGASTAFTVRLPALLCMAGTWLVARAFARRLVLARGGSELAAERAGLLALVLVMFAPVLAVFSVYISTDPPLLFFWMLTLYLGWRALEESRWRFWLGAGAAFGLALESKFLALLLAPSVALCLLVARGTAPRPRPLRIAAALAVAAAMLAPLLIWNATHDWATFGFNFRSRHIESQAAWHNPPTYLLGQLALLSPPLCVLLVIGLVQAWCEWRRERVRASLYLFLAAAVPLGAFLGVSLERGVGAHWPTAAWFSAIVFLAAAHGLGRPWVGKRFVRWSVGVCVGLTMFMHGFAHVPQRYLDFDLAWVGRPDRVRLKAFAERYGWPELGAAAAQARDELAAASGRPAFLAAAQYGLAASVAFHAPGQPHVHLWSERRHHGDNYHHWDDYTALVGQDAVFVVKRRPHEHLASLRARFARVEEPVELPIVSDGEVVRSFWLVRCHRFDGREPFPREVD
jgi:hypothetical protein